MKSVSFVNGRHTVYEIPHDGVAECRSVSSDLMGATRLKGPLHEGSLAMHSPRPRAKAFEGGLTGLSFKWEGRNSGCGFPFACMPGMVGLGELGPLGLKPFLRCLCSRKHDGPTRPVIQAMNRLPRTARRKAHVSVDLSAERVFSPAVHGHSCRFQHHGVVYVMVENRPISLHGDKFMAKACLPAVNIQVLERVILMVELRICVDETLSYAVKPKLIQ